MSKLQGPLCEPCSMGLSVYAILYDSQMQAALRVRQANHAFLNTPETLRELLLAEHNADKAVVDEHILTLAALTVNDCTPDTFNVINDSFNALQNTTKQLEAIARVVELYAEERPEHLPAYQL